MENPTTLHVGTAPFPHPGRGRWAQGRLKVVLSLLAATSGNGGPIIIHPLLALRTTCRVRTPPVLLLRRCMPLVRFPPPRRYLLRSRRTTLLLPNLLGTLPLP